MNASRYQLCSTTRISNNIRVLPFPGATGGVSSDSRCSRRCSNAPPSGRKMRSEERRVGKSVRCCVDLGGRRIIKKKKKKKKKKEKKRKEKINKILKTKKK